MDGQQLITILIVALAAAYLLRRTYRRWSGRSATGCAAACSGCAIAGATRVARPRPFISADALDSEPSPEPRVVAVREKANGP